MNIKRITQNLIAFEGIVTHMYLDGAGVVTIGVGHAIETIEEADTIKWNGTGYVKEWLDIRKLPALMPASWYASATKCRISMQEVDRLLAADIAEFERQLLAQWPGKFELLPEGVQCALFDMAYNLGMGGLLKYKRMLAAINAGDWKVAAEESHRNGVQATRNTKTALMIMEAAHGRSTGDVPGPDDRVSQGA